MSFPTRSRMPHILFLALLIGCGGAPTDPAKSTESPTRTAAPQASRNDDLPKWVVMKVADTEISLESMRYGWSTMRVPGADNTKLQYVLDRLLQRAILAQAATAKGLKAERDEIVETYLNKGQFFALGLHYDLLADPTEGATAFMKPKPGGSDDPTKREWVVDYELLGKLLMSWGLPGVDGFLEEQRYEVLAEKMRASLRESARVGADEVRARFDHQNTTATIDAVAFRPGDYRSKLVFGEADVARYLATHRAKVRRKYELDRRLYLAHKPTVRISQIVIERPEKQSGAGAGGAGQPAADAGRRAADAAHARLAAGEDFAAVARDVSKDPAAKKKGGDLGWRNRDYPGLGSMALAGAMKDLKPGAHSPVIETAGGYYILYIAALRQGDLSFDQVAHEIAEQMMLRDYAKTLAREDAEATLAELKTGVRLAQLFEKVPDQPGIDVSQLPPEFMKSLTPELRDELKKSLKPSPPAQGAAPIAIAPGPLTTVTSLPIARPLDISKPRYRRIGPFTRDPDIAGLGRSEAMVKSIFEDVKAGGVAPRVFEIDGHFAVFTVAEQTRPDADEFERDKVSIEGYMTVERAREAVHNWVSKRCLALAEAGRVAIHQRLLQNLLGTGSKFSYRVCSTLD